MTTTRSSNPTIIIICGPTAAGKTAVGIEVAKTFKGEIISADSRQFYSEMSIGTAKPTKDEMGDVPHHFVGTHSISNPLTAGEFERQGEKVLQEILTKGKIPIIVGGSGLFIQALVTGLDDLPSDDKLRQELIKAFDENGIEVLYQRLEKSDPNALELIDAKNPVRVMRAIELVELSQTSLAEIRKDTKPQKHFNPIWIGINSDRALLYQRIDKRVDKMLQEGLEEEARSLLLYKESDALKTVGYREFFGYFDDQYDREEAIRLIKRNSRRYAKRQITWFSKIKGMQWFEPHDLNRLFSLISHRLSQSEYEW